MTINKAILRNILKKAVKVKTFLSIPHVFHKDLSGLVDQGEISLLDEKMDISIMPDSG